jgi:hypothetical protein
LLAAVVDRHALKLPETYGTPPRPTVPQLPFVVAPKRETRIVSATVNDEVCSLEFPVFGSILAGEDIAIRDHEYQGAVYREASRLADAILLSDANTVATEQEANTIAIRLLSHRMGIPVPLEPAEQRILMQESELIASMQSTLAEEYQRQVVRIVTAAIANRLPGCRDWSEADTEGLPQPLQTAIANFIDDERRGKAPAKSPDELVQEMTETLGKLAPSSAPEEPTPSPSTGPEPTGAADGSGPPPQSSPPIDSPASPAPTSTRRSKKAKPG